MTLKLKSIIAMVTALALLVTGTFAFSQAIHKVNEFIGQADGTTLHDDFDPETGQKDVYVENQGSLVVYARIKLSEVMDLKTFHKPEEIDDMWQAHIYGATAENCGNDNDDDALFHDYFKWSMGGSKWYMPSNGKQLMQDTNKYTSADESKGAKETPNAVIIYYEDFIDMSYEARLDFYGWVYTDDGYAYWSQPLKKGDVTGLLLSGVETSDSLKNKDYYYAIDVYCETVDLEDIPMWTEGAAASDKSGTTYDKAEVSTGGKPTIDKILEMPFVQIRGGDRTISVDQRYKPGVAVTKGLESSVKWESSSSAIATVDEDTGEIVGVSPGTVTITVTVKDKNDKEFTDTIKITVSMSGGTGTGTTEPGDPGEWIKNPGTTYTVSGKDYIEAKAKNSVPDDEYENVIVEHGFIHLEDIIADGNYDGLTVESLESKYVPYANLFSPAEIFTINTEEGCRAHGKPSIQYDYFPSFPEWFAFAALTDDCDIDIDVNLRLTREDDKSADIIISMMYRNCLPTLT